MVRPWLVRLELARDDNGSLTDQGLADLTDGLTKAGAQPALTRGDSGTLLVEMTVDANNREDAKSGGQALLREQANRVWLALGLPPFTIAFVEAQPKT
jgi:hypothetical protein